MIYFVLGFLVGLIFGVIGLIEIIIMYGRKKDEQSNSKR